MALFIGFIISIIGTLILTPIISKNLLKRNEVALIRELGPNHQSKAGTPSMGGIGFILSTTIGLLVANMFSGTNFRTPDIYFMVVSYFAYGIIGFLDDAIKLILKRDEGFRFLPKLAAQIASALLVLWLMIYFHFQPQLTVPFFGNFNIGYIAFFGLIVIWFVGWSNATNLTDGLDGLLTGLAIISFSSYFFVATMQNNIHVQIFDFSIIGGLLAFLFFNKPKASIFMGDTGSLAIGAALAMNSIVLRDPFSLLIFGFIYVIETASVIIQVLGYRILHRRIFPMAPLHHSFEKYGWGEWKVVSFFWIIQLIASIIGVLIIGR